MCWSPPPNAQLLDALVYSHRASTPEPLYRKLVDGLLAKPRADDPTATTVNIGSLSVLSELCSCPHRGIANAAANILWVCWGVLPLMPAVAHSGGGLLLSPYSHPPPTPFCVSQVMLSECSHAVRRQLQLGARDSGLLLRQLWYAVVLVPTSQAQHSFRAACCRLLAALIQGNPGYVVFQYPGWASSGLHSTRSVSSVLPT